MNEGRKWAGIPILGECRYGAGQFAYRLEGDRYIIHTGGRSANARVLERGQVEEVARAQRPELCQGWPIHDPVGGRLDARIVLARRILGLGA